METLPAVVSAPRYPQARVRLGSRNHYALVSAVRFALRRLGAPPEEVRRFTQEALASGDPANAREVCARWADIGRDEAAILDSPTPRHGGQAG
jgi:hypothetical protein